MSKIEKERKIDNICNICEEKILYSDNGVIIMDDFFRTETLYHTQYILDNLKIHWVCLKCFDNNTKIMIKETIKQYDFTSSTYKPEIKIETFEKCICGKGIKQKCTDCSSYARVCLACETEYYNLKWCEQCEVDYDI